MAQASKAALLARRFPTGTVELDGIGAVTVRGLSRAEVAEMGKRANAGEDMEAQGLAWAMVDPPMTVEEATEWCAVAPFGEIQAITVKINELSGISGLARNANKEAYKSPGD